MGTCLLSHAREPASRHEVRRLASTAAQPPHPVECPLRGARAARSPAPSGAPGRRACRSRPRGRGPARCWRRCARAGRRAFGGPGERGNGRQRKFWSSASDPAYGSPWWRFGFAAWRSAGESAVRRSSADSRFGMCRASRAWIRSAYRSRSSSVQVPSPASISPAASPLTCHGSSWSWIQSMPLPSGARLGSIVSGWPQTIVASAGSSPRSASFTARETPSRPGVRWTIAVLREPLVAVPAQARRARSGSASRSARSGTGGRPGRPRRPGCRAAGRRAASVSRSRSPPASPRSSRRRRCARPSPRRFGRATDSTSAFSQARRRRDPRSGGRAPRRASRRRRAGRASRLPARRPRSPAS